jgi:endonuclease-8
MPEGPSIVILKEKAEKFAGHRVLSAIGTAEVGQHDIENRTVKSVQSWGKHFLIVFDKFFLRVHLLMFGTYRIDSKRDKPPKLGLVFNIGELNLYACNVKRFDGNPDKVYDWSADVMNPAWSVRKAMAKLKRAGDSMICDALLDQEIFSGVGNIIKNEVLYRCRIHPESFIGKIPVTKLREIARESATYAFEFLKWKKGGTLKKHWVCYAQKRCRRCDLPMHKKETGAGRRRSFFCTNCQKLHI